ncbi:hypothetical protein [Cryobacterium adonitolivorans]|uniref:hypothetical protein n=1 Tax=Cryobacterium adonitolivorans TaxID=1259189 RepID=UPI002105C10F|nr:hypothetical protein [Cryobacterium adonitolivorans]
MHSWRKRRALARPQSPGAREALRRGLRIVTVEHELVDRAVTEAQTGGYTQLVVDGRGRLLGGTVVGPRAGETLGEITLAVKNRLTTGDIAGTTHAYPTHSDGLWNAAIADLRRRPAPPARVGAGIEGHPHPAPGARRPRSREVQLGLTAGRLAVTPSETRRQVLGCTDVQPIAGRDRVACFRPFARPDHYM